MRHDRGMTLRQALLAVAFAVALVGWWILQRRARGGGGVTPPS
jgi:hypothetical protein